MADASHRQAGIPRELADAVDDMIRRHRWLGHRSLSGFATEACRRLLRECYEDVERRDRVGTGGSPEAQAQWTDGSAPEAEPETSDRASPRRSASNHGWPT